MSEDARPGIGEGVGAGGAPVTIDGAVIGDRIYRGLITAFAICIPLLLLLIYLFWIILLYGAAVAFSGGLIGPPDEPRSCDPGHRRPIAAPAGERAQPKRGPSREQRQKKRP